jgi:hypothetical protein
MLPSFARLLAGVVVAAAIAAVAIAPAAAPATVGSAAAKSAPSKHALLASRELWATIDVCNPPDQAHTVGIRGSMPGDGQAHDKMYMSFRLQYMNASRHWVDLASGTAPSFVAVGGGGAARQGGTSFELKPVTGKPPVTLRGVVGFQWRHGSTVMLTTSQTTTAAHKSLAGADPANFTAATCIIG